MYGNEDSFLTNSTKPTLYDNEQGGRTLRQRPKKDYALLPDTFINNTANGLKNGRWTLDEHKRFLTGVFEYGNNWKGIVQVIGTRNCAQARSHGQKFFAKLQKMDLEGITEEMCNVKYLHTLHKKVLSKEESNELFYLLTEIAFRRMEKTGDESEMSINQSSLCRVSLKDSEYDIGK
jgi:SHAQKYF class myb-like DNA-binding protein